MPVLSGPAVENIRNSVIREVVVTNTIPLTPEAQVEAEDPGAFDRGIDWRAIQSIHEETSVSKLFM